MGCDVGRGSKNVSQAAKAITVRSEIGPLLATQAVTPALQKASNKFERRPNPVEVSSNPALEPKDPFSSSSLSLSSSVAGPTEELETQRRNLGEDDVYSTMDAERNRGKGTGWALTTYGSTSNGFDCSEPMSCTPVAVFSPDSAYTRRDEDSGCGNESENGLSWQEMLEMGLLLGDTSQQHISDWVKRLLQRL